jgi:hypothetical protein
VNAVINADRLNVKRKTLTIRLLLFFMIHKDNSKFINEDDTDQLSTGLLSVGRRPSRSVSFAFPLDGIDVKSWTCGHNAAPM